MATSQSVIKYSDSTMERAVTIVILRLSLAHIITLCLVLRKVPTIVIAHTFCASPDTRISYRQCLLTQGYFCAV